METDQLPFLEMLCLFLVSEKKNKRETVLAPVSNYHKYIGLKPHTCMIFEVKSPKWVSQS